MGHRGVNFGVQMEGLGLPAWRTGHWDAVFGAAQDAEMPINFHIGFQREKNKSKKIVSDLKNDRLGYVSRTALGFAGNMDGIAETIISRIAHRFPRLNFVSVESGYGYVPFLLEALDWQFKNSLAHKEYPDMLLPSEYFRRQIYATFWFESQIHRQIDLYPDNVMFESDFPHPTSLSPGPGTHALAARETIEANLSQLDDATLRKVLHDTAAKVYRLG
jgi:predicted TIM-barrel fold metal-dependent hydrolase